MEAYPIGGRAATSVAPEAPSHPERPDVLPIRGRTPDPIAELGPVRDVGGWLTLLHNIRDVRGPIAERLRRHARKRLREAGWRVSRDRKAVQR